MNDFTSKWQDIESAGHSGGRYRAVSDHSLDLFLSYSISGDREFALESNRPLPIDARMPEFEHIGIYYGKVGHTHALTLCLKDSRLKDLFSVICFDLTKASQAASTESEATRIFISRLSRWAELLRWRTSQGLSPAERLGLMGELSMLSWIIDHSEISPEVIVRGWRGPEGDTNDIGLNRVRIEVKAQMATQTPNLKISSINQLNHDERELCVSLLRFLAAKIGISLKAQVKVIASLLPNGTEGSMEFQRKLMLVGYDPEAEYIEDCFNLDSLRIYRVDRGFPRLVPENVPLGITKVKYEISCDSLGEFEIDQQQLEGLISA